MTGRVAVLGGGPAGVMASLIAARRGFDVTLFEARDQLGGMAASFDVDGVMVDHGSHRLHPVVPPQVWDVIEPLLGDELQQRDRKGRIALKGQWLKFPLELTDLVKKLPPKMIAKIGWDTIAGPFRRIDETDAESAVRARLGPTVAEDFYLPYFAKLWDVPMSELAVEIADRRIANRGALDVLKKILAPRAQPFDYLYPRRGFGQITQVVADAAREAGVTVELGARVEHVTLADDGVTLTVGGHEHQFDTVLSSIPIPVLGRLADAPAPLVEAAGRLRHRAMVLLYLTIGRPQVTTFDAHYFPELSTPVSRMNEPKNYRVSADDPTDLTVLCAEIPCWRGDDIWEADSDDLAARVIPTLEPLGFDLTPLIATQVVREPAVYPVYDGQYAGDLEKLEAWVHDQPRLVTFGRQGLFNPDNTHHALLMGMEAAQVIAPDGTIDEPRWARLRESYRTHVVVD